MPASYVYDDDLETIIMAADESPEYKEDLIENFVSKHSKRSKRRLSDWSSAVLILLIAVFCSILVDRVVSFPLSAFALLFVWLGLLGVYAVNRVLSVIESSLLRILLKRLLSRREPTSFVLTIVDMGLKRLRRW
ncbi:MAG TPA: hypothetical protein VEG44_10445 [Candidatus Acidoferrales bacterium]|nr:hypothetical protein [Candidatus Acidoferrales bacterium]